MKYRLKVIIMIVVVLCLSLATISSAIRYEDRYYRAVMQDDPNLYFKFDGYMPYDATKHYCRLGYIKNITTDQEANDCTKVALKAGGIKGCLLTDNTLYLGSGHQDSGAYAFNWMHSSTAERYGGNSDIYSFGGPGFPQDMSFEFWYKTLPTAGTAANPQGEPEPNQPCYFFQQAGSPEWLPQAPGIGTTQTGTNPPQFRVLAGTRFWNTGVTAPFDEQWHHVVVTYEERYDDANDNAMRIQLYLDGQLQGSTIAYGNNNNLVVNHDFEAPTLAPWIAKGAATLYRETSDSVDGDVSGWAINRTAATDGMQQSLLGKMYNGYIYRFSSYGCTDDETQQHPVRAFIEQTDDAGTQTFVIRTGDFDYSQWYEFQPNGRFTLNVTGTLTAINICFDGPPAGIGIGIDAFSSVPMFAGTQGRLGPELVSMTIGGLYHWGFITQPYAGYMDEFAIYDSLLSSDRVLAHYNAFQPVDCAELWQRGNPLSGGWDRDWSGGYITWEPEVGRPESGPTHWDPVTGENVGFASDLNQDCKVNLVDFALLASEWAKCNNPTGGAGCTANW